MCTLGAWMIIHSSSCCVIYVSLWRKGMPGRLAQNPALPGCQRVRAPDVHLLPSGSPRRKAGVCRAGQVCRHGNEQPERCKWHLFLCRNPCGLIKRSLSFICFKCSPLSFRLSWRPEDPQWDRRHSAAVFIWVYISTIHEVFHFIGLLFRLKSDN